MTLYSRRTFSKESFQWTKCVVKYLYDSYSHLSLNMLAFLVEVSTLLYTYLLNKVPFLGLWAIANNKCKYLTCVHWDLGTFNILHISKHFSQRLCFTSDQVGGISDRLINIHSILYSVGQWKLAFNSQRVFDEKSLHALVVDLMLMDAHIQCSVLNSATCSCCFQH